MGYQAEYMTVLLVALAIIFVFLSVKTVKQGYHYTVERFGRYTRTLEPGLNVIIPFIDRLGRKVNMMETVLNVPSQEVITRDNATVRADGVTYYQVIDAARAAYEVNHLEKAILNLTMTNIRNVMGSMDLDALLANRDEINHQLLSVVDAATEPWGVKVTRIEIKDIDPPADLVASMARQMKAERDKRAAILEAEGLRQSEVLRADGDKQAQILQAEGRREAAFKDAEARERLAEAEARATSVLSEAVASGSVQALNYFVAEKYMHTLGEIGRAPNQKIFMLPVEAASVIGAIGGIADIAKESFGGTIPPQSPPPGDGTRAPDAADRGARRGPDQAGTANGSRDGHPKGQLGGQGENTSDPGEQFVDTHRLPKYDGTGREAAGVHRPTPVGQRPDIGTSRLHAAPISTIKLTSVPQIVSGSD